MMTADRSWIRPRRPRRMWLWLAAAVLPLALLVMGLISPRVATIEIGEASLTPAHQQAADEWVPDDAALSGWLAE